MSKKVMIALIAVLAMLLLLPAAALADTYQIVWKTPGTGDYGADLTKVGYISVTPCSEDQGVLHARFYTYPGYEFLETHLAVAQDKGGIPQNNGGPIPGQFPWGDEWSPPVTYVRYDINLTELGLTPPLTVVAHAVVARLADGAVETGWATGCWLQQYNFDGNDWARWFPYPKP